MLQNATPLRKSVPEPPNISEEHVSCTAPGSSSNVPCLPSSLDMLENLHVLLILDKVQNPLRLPRKTTSEPSKVVGACGAFYILTSKCASRHNGVHFFDIWTSKSALNMEYFLHFDFEMCFAPQRRALFQGTEAASHSLAISEGSEGNAFHEAVSAVPLESLL